MRTSPSPVQCRYQRMFKVCTRREKLNTKVVSSSYPYICILFMFVVQNMFSSSMQSYRLVATVLLIADIRYYCECLLHQNCCYDQKEEVGPQFFLISHLSSVRFNVLLLPTQEKNGKYSKQVQETMCCFGVQHLHIVFHTSIKLIFQIIRMC